MIWLWQDLKSNWCALRFWQTEMKKALREMQTLCAGCSKAEPKIFPGAWYGQNLISCRWDGENWQLHIMILLPTNPVWWGSTHAISSYRGNRPINIKHTYTHKNKQTHRQVWLQYTVQLSLARSVNITICRTYGIPKLSRLLCLTQCITVI